MKKTEEQIFQNTIQHYLEEGDFNYVFELIQTKTNNIPKIFIWVEEKIDDYYQQITTTLVYLDINLLENRLFFDKRLLISDEVILRLNILSLELFLNQSSKDESIKDEQYFLKFLDKFIEWFKNRGYADIIDKYRKAIFEITEICDCPLPNGERYNKTDFIQMLYAKSKMTNKIEIRLIDNSTRIFILPDSAKTRKGFCKWVSEKFTVTGKPFSRKTVLSAIKAKPDDRKKSS